MRFTLRRAYFVTPVCRAGGLIVADSGAVRRDTVGTTTVTGGPAPTHPWRQGYTAVRAGTRRRYIRGCCGWSAGAQQVMRGTPGRPSKAHHPADQLGHRLCGGPWNDRGVSISQKPTHDHRLSAGEPAQQIRGRPTRRIGPTLRIPGVLGDSFHLPDRIRSTRQISRPQPGQRQGERRRTPGELQRLGRQRRAHPVATQCDRPINQHRPSRPVHPPHPPRRPLPLDRDRNAGQLGQDNGPHSRSVRPTGHDSPGNRCNVFSPSVTNKGRIRDAADGS